MIKILKYIYKTLGIVILKKRVFILINRIKRGREKQKVNITTFSIRNKHVFFGYYDVTPFSPDDQKVLSLVVPKSRNTNSEAQVGYFNTKNSKEFHQVGTTKTWCWQQGARLHWSSQNPDVIVYNNLNNKQYGCVFQNINSKKILKQVSYPVYDLSKNEKLGLSLNFSRLQRLRPGYGYDAIPDSTVHEKKPEKDGVFLIDTERNTSELIISLKTIAEIEPQSSMEGAEHYINHLSWNKSSTRFLFFHLWTNGKIRSSRLFTADRSGKDIYLLENNEAVSHYDWKDDEYICLTTHSKEFGSRYSIYKDKSEERNVLESKSLRSDGHPTYHPKKKKILLSDTYPDKYGERRLFTFNLDKQKLQPLGAYKSPLKYRNDYRCDLHPRWNHEGTLIAFDSTHTNQRTLNTISFEDTLYS